MQALRDDPTVCITFPEDAYRKDGSIMIHRNNRSIRLHRYLAEQLGCPVERGVYLHPDCKTTGCMNPFHRKASRRSSVGRNATSCPVGHKYTAANLLTEGRYRCRTCRDARNARRRTGPRGGGYCGKGIHRLTASNVYVETDVTGRVHRRCAPCHIAYMKKRRSS